jgi:hypothetical protein
MTSKAVEEFRVFQQEPVKSNLFFSFSFFVSQLFVGCSDGGLFLGNCRGHCCNQSSNR